MSATIHTLGELRTAVPARSHATGQSRRSATIWSRKLQAGEPLFPGIIGYDDTVIPQLVNAILSRHNFILLGLRGQAKSRILRALVDLLDEQIPVDARLRDSRRSAGPDLRRLPGASRRRGRRAADRLAAARGRASSRSWRRRT